MAAPRTHTLAALDLPRSLLWVDEFDWTPVARAQEYSLTGALIVDQAMRQAGRPITLQGVDDHGWVRRDVLALLWDLAATADGPLPLVLADGRTFSVRFAADNAIQAEQIARAELPPAHYPYIVTVRLVTA